MICYLGLRRTGVQDQIQRIDTMKTFSLQDRQPFISFFNAKPYSAKYNFRCQTNKVVSTHEAPTLLSSTGFDHAILEQTCLQD